MLKLVLHVGVHKTASTAIQFALAASRPYLKSHGVFFPVGLHASTAHHSVAWQLLKRPLQGLRIHEWVAPVEERVRAWTRQAINEDCTSMVLSAEDLSYCSSADLWRIIEAAQSETNVETTIVWASRDRESLRRSFYKTLLLHGLSQQFTEAAPIIDGHFDRFRTRIEAGSHLGSMAEIIRVDYCPRDSGQTPDEYLRNMLTSLVGGEPAAWIQETAESMVTNKSISDEMADRLLRYNQVATPWMRLDSRTGAFSSDLYAQVPAIQEKMRHLGFPV